MTDLKSNLSADLRAFDDPRVFVEEILGIDWLYDWQMDTFLSFYNGDYRELVCCVGQRSGKTLLGSLIATYELFKLLVVKKPNSYLNMPTGSDIFIINVATSQTQAKDTVFSEIESRIDNCAWFKQYEYNKKAREYEFFTEECKIVIRSEHSNSSSLAGHTCKAVILDEVGRFKDTAGATGAELVYDTLKRTTRTFGKKGKMVLISSPMYKDDFLMQQLRYGKPRDDFLTVHKATWECNPNITMEDLEQEFDRNPESAWRDYGARPPESLETYFKEPERIDLVVDFDPIMPPSEYEVPDIPQIKYPCFIAGDPALKNDAFGISMCHVEGDKVVVDLCHYFDPTGYDVVEVDAEKVSDFILELIKQHNVVGFWTDIWNFPLALQKIRRAGVPVHQNTVKKEQYDNLKELIYTQKIIIPQSKAVKELKSLELINGKKVDHPPRGSKDVADSLANCVWAATENKDMNIEPMLMVV